MQVLTIIMSKESWHHIGTDRIPLYSLIWVWESVYDRACLAKWDGTDWIEPVRSHDTAGFRPTHWRHIDKPERP